MCPRPGSPASARRTARRGPDRTAAGRAGRLRVIRRAPVPRRGRRRRDRRGGARIQRRAQRSRAVRRPHRPPSALRLGSGAPARGPHGRARRGGRARGEQPVRRAGPADVVSVAGRGKSGSAVSDHRAAAPVRWFGAIRRGTPGYTGTARVGRRWAAGRGAECRVGQSLREQVRAAWPVSRAIAMSADRGTTARTGGRRA